jgi:hypothetical protein
MRGKQTMISGFTKLFGSILTSTIWQESPATCKVWITLLAMANADGEIQASVPGLAHVAQVSLNQTEAALAKFLAPDKYSSTPDFEGRRIEVIAGGWRLLNYEKYREKLSEEDRKEKARLRQQRHRERKACHTQSVTECDSRDMSRVSLHTEEESEEVKDISSNADASDEPDLSKPLQNLWNYYLAKIGGNPKTYSFSTLRKRKGIARLRECLKKTAGDVEAAVGLMKVCVDALAESDFHMGRDPKTNGRRYCEWEDHLFKSYERMEKWWNYEKG